jgi:lysophospholipase L1-like esterase
MRRRQFVLAGLVLGGLAAGCLLGEGVLRGYARLDPTWGRQVASWDPMGIRIEPFGEAGYRPRPNTVISFPNSTAAHVNAEGFRGPPVAQPKPPGTVRIVMSGGSTTHGWGVNDDGTIDSHLRSLLREQWPDQPIEVVNLGFDGYDSWQVFERLRSNGLELDPDLLIVNVGINDVRNARYTAIVDHDPRTLLYEADLRRLRAAQLRGGPTLATRLKHYSLLARLPSFVRGELARRRAAKSVRQTPPFQDAAGYFTRNVARILALAAERGIPVILSTPPSSLRLRFAPGDTSSISYWVVDAETTQRYRDELAHRLDSLATTERQSGHDVRYLRPTLDNAMFLDDCHLTEAGNRQLAADFADALRPFLDGRARVARSGGLQ